MVSDCVICDEKIKKNEDESSFYNCDSKTVCKDCVVKHYSILYNINLMRIDKCIVCGEEYTDSEIEDIKRVLTYKTDEEKDSINDSQSDSSQTERDDNRNAILYRFEAKIQEKKDSKKQSNKTPEAVRIEEKELLLFRQKINCLKESIETPCCGGYFTVFDGCLAIRCGLCETSYFCGVCYEVITNKDPHDHIRKEECKYYFSNNNVFGSENTVKEYMRKRRIYSVLKAVVFFKEEKCSIDEKKGVVLELYEEEKKVFSNLFDLFETEKDLKNKDFRDFFKKRIYNDEDNIYHNDIEERNSYWYIARNLIPPKTVFEKNRVKGYMFD